MPENEIQQTSFSCSNSPNAPQRIIVGVGKKVSLRMGPTIQLPTVLTEKEEELLSSLGSKEADICRAILAQIKSCFPDFIYAGGNEVEIKNDLHTYVNTLSKKETTPVEVSSYMTRIFRLEEPERSHVMQRSGNCFLVASLYSLVHNSFFLKELSDTLEVRGDGFGSQWTFFGSNGAHTVSTKDIRLDFSIPSLSDTSDDVIERFAIQLLPHIRDSQGSISEYKDGFFRKNQKPKKKFIKEIQLQISKQKGALYDYWITEEKKANTIFPIAGPIGYRILESIYAKIQISPTPDEFMDRIVIGEFDKNIRKVSSKGGFAKDVMAAFLDKSKWKVSTIGFSSEIEKSIVESVLFLFSQGSAVVVASVDKKEDPKDILLDDFIITDNHAYSVTHFNPELHTISLVNPWDSHCTKEIPLEVFFTLFSRVSFAYRI